MTPGTRARRRLTRLASAESAPCPSRAAPSAPSLADTAAAPPSCCCSLVVILLILLSDTRLSPPSTPLSHLSSASRSDSDACNAHRNASTRHLCAAAAAACHKNASDAHVSAARATNSASVGHANARRACESPAATNAVSCPSLGMASTSAVVAPVNAAYPRTTGVTGAYRNRVTRGGGGCSDETLFPLL